MEAREEQRNSANREELAERLGRAIGHNGILDPIPGVRLARSSQPTQKVFSSSRPSFCIIAQGAKEIYLGDSRYYYDAERYLVATVELPITGRVLEASPSRPYLGIRIEIDQAMVSSVMVESGMTSPTSQGGARAMYVSTVGSDLIDATLRFVRLLETPADAPVLMPLIKREMVYRLLIGEQGDRLKHLPMLGGHSHRIAQAVDRLKTQFDQPVSIDALAKDLGMSSSGFHHHFKSVMDMSPLQYQKVLRLQVARQLMLGENLDASTAGYRVGYDNPSHFSRDYKKFYGNAPIRDVAILRGQPASSSVSS